MAAPYCLKVFTVIYENKEKTFKLKNRLMSHETVSCYFSTSYLSLALFIIRSNPENIKKISRLLSTSARGRKQHSSWLNIFNWRCCFKVSKHSFHFIVAHFGCRHH